MNLIIFVLVSIIIIYFMVRLPRANLMPVWRPCPPSALHLRLKEEIEKNITDELKEQYKVFYTGQAGKGHWVQIFVDSEGSHLLIFDYWEMVIRTQRSGFPPPPSPFYAWFGHDEYDRLYINELNISVESGSKDRRFSTSRVGPFFEFKLAEEVRSHTLGREASVIEILSKHRDSFEELKATDTLFVEIVRKSGRMAFGSLLKIA